MNRIKSSLKSNISPNLMNQVNNLRHGIGRLINTPNAMLHPQRQQSIKRLRELKDIHRGERCFILGNGPSLNNTNLSLLKNEFTFGTNRIYMLFDELGFETSYFVSINSLVIEQCINEIREIQAPKFLSWRSREFVTNHDDYNFLYTRYSGPRFAKDCTKQVWEGATVTYVCMQLAFHMGFDEVILIGVDHNFATTGQPNTTITSEGDDINHFNQAYFGKGFKWQLPDLETSEWAYTMARDAYNNAGRRIVDATNNGKLTIFPKVSYEDLF